MSSGSSGVALEILAVLVSTDEVSPLDCDGRNLVRLDRIYEVAENNVFVLFFRCGKGLEDKKSEED